MKKQLNYKMEILQQMGSLPIFLVMFIIIYFLMIRPQSLQQKNHKNMLENLKKGDRVITRGGIMGKIFEFKGKNQEIIILEINNNSKVEILKDYIISLSKK